MFRECPIRDVRKAFTQSAKSLKIYNRALHGVDIHRLEYRSYKFVLGIDTGKILEAGFTGNSAKAGDLMAFSKADKFQEVPKPICLMKCILLYIPFIY